MIKKIKFLLKNFDAIKYFIENYTYFINLEQQITKKIDFTTEEVNNSINNLKNEIEVEIEKLREKKVEKPKTRAALGAVPKAQLDFIQKKYTK